MTTRPIFPEPEAETDNSFEHTGIVPSAESMTPERRAWMRAILDNEEANNPGVAWAEWLGSALLALDAAEVEARQAEADLQNCLRAHALDAIILNAAAQIMGVQAIDPQNEEEAVALAQKLHARAGHADEAEITPTSIIADFVDIVAKKARAKTWLQNQLVEAGIHPDVSPCDVVADFTQVDGVWAVTGCRCWCGDSRLSGSRSLSVAWSAVEARVSCESYGGHKTYGVGNGATVEEAIKNLLSEPRRGGVPAAFLAGVASCL